MSDSPPSGRDPADEHGAGSGRQEREPPRRHRLLKFFAELKQRRVLRVAGVYSVAAWLTMQIADVVFPALHFPDAAVTFVVVILLLGFPVALALAWVFDVTPDGEVLTAPGGSGSDFGTAWGLPVAFVVVLGLAGIAAVSLRGGDGDDVAAAVEDPRVAILYLEYDEDDAELAALASGLTNGLIVELQQVPGLTVISENGVRRFRGQPVPAESIAAALRAGTLVGGNISRSGSKLRVHPQLIDGADGHVITASIIERETGELFALLDDLGQEVSLLLRKHLGREVRLRRWRAGTRSTEAWQMVQQAVQLVQDAHVLRTAGDLAGGLQLLGSADSILARAELQDPRWTEPLIQRGWVARHRAFAALNAGRHDPAELAANLDRGLHHVERALALVPADAAALELRGMIRYARWLLAAPPEPAAAALLAGAEADLRGAIRNNPGRLPRAWITLSAILHNNGQLEESVKAAERAYAADAFAEETAANLSRLFTITFETGRDSAAASWCGELRRRQPGHWPSAYCELMLLGWTAPGPDAVRRAEQHLYSFGSADPVSLRELMRPRLEMLYAGVLTRNGQADSARRVMEEARAAAPEDRELLQLEAGVRLILGDHDRAAELLRHYFETGHAQRSFFQRSRRFAALQGHPLWSAPVPAGLNSR
jgi:TolB-like protein